MDNFTGMLTKPLFCFLLLFTLFWLPFAFSQTTPVAPKQPPAHIKQKPVSDDFRGDFYIEMKGVVRQSKISEVEEIIPIDSAIISISGANFAGREIYTGKNGKCVFRLPLGKTFRVEISKKDFVTKILMVSSNVPFDRIKDYTFNFDLDLLSDIKGLDVSVLKKPIAKVVYDFTDEQFEYDENYTNFINSSLKEMYKDYYDLQKIQTFRNNPIQIIEQEKKHTIPLPEKFKRFDFDANGGISYAEIIRVIDAFSKGDTTIRLKDISALIDFYFEE